MCIWQGFIRIARKFVFDLFPFNFTQIWPSWGLDWNNEGEIGCGLELWKLKALEAEEEVVLWAVGKEKGLTSCQQLTDKVIV